MTSPEETTSVGRCYRVDLPAELAALEQRGNGRREARVSSVDRALRELAELVTSAGEVLAGTPGAAAVFGQLIEGASAAAQTRGSPRIGDGLAAPALRDGSLSSYRGRRAAHFQVLQAGLSLDLAERAQDGRWTARARASLDARTELVDRYLTALRAHRDRPTGDRSKSSPGRDLGIPAEPDLPDRGAATTDVCLDLYHDLAAQAVRDDALDRVHTVLPNCVCHDFDPAQVFVAEPRPGEQFPDPLPADMTLFFGGEDITSRMVRADARRIEFRLPRDPHTGVVYLRRLDQITRQRIADVTALCGGIGPAIPERVLLERSPGALISIVYPPVIDDVIAAGESIRDMQPTNGVYTVAAEACRPIEICWRARASDRAASEPPAQCASVEVTFTDKAGWRSPPMPATGCLVVQDGDTRELSIQATSRIANTSCGTSSVVRLRVQREHHLRLRLDPTNAKLAEGTQGQLVVSTSCPAPAGGRTVRLVAGPPAALVVPDTVVIPEGHAVAAIAFFVRSPSPRTVTVTATAPAHRKAVLAFEIYRPRAIVLSGGGAKGSFQVGAIAYFRRERWDEVEPDIVVGTSVGAINALGIAEGVPPDGSPDGVQRMERVWLGLRGNDDMYVDSVWVTRLKELFADLGDVSAYARPEAIVPGLLLGGTFGGLIGLAAGAGARAADKLGEIVDVIKQIKFLYSLAPTRALVSTTVRFDRIAASGKTLRLATVCLEDGLVYHVTEAGTIVSDVGRDPAFTGTLAGPLAMALTNGAMASAGIPVVFPFRSEPVAVDGTTRFMTLVDGGVREVLPIRTASELGAQFIIAVSAGPNRVVPYESPFNGETITQFRNESILDIAVRSQELATREVAHTEILPDGGFCDGVDRVVVVPSFPVHGTQEVDPGLILINMAYGYMRAFEMYARFRQAVNTLQLFLLVGLSDQIVGLRKQIWELEERVLLLTDEAHGPRPVPDVPAGEVATYPAAARFFDGPTLREIRRLKQEVFDLVVERARNFGPEAVPARFDDPTTGYLNPITGWWNAWERHKEPLESLIRGFNPWSTLPIRVRVVVRSGLGVPQQVFETSIPPSPVLPPDLAALPSGP